MIVRRIAAVSMRGGASKALVFHARDLPNRSAERDAILLRMAGGPDPHGHQVDGVGAFGGMTRVVIVAPSRRDDCDVDFLVGEIPLDKAMIDWSREAGSLSAAVGPFAISEGLVSACDGVTCVRMLQMNTGRRVDAFVPVRHGEVLEQGAFIEDGVPHPSAEIRLEFHEPAGDLEGRTRPLLPTGREQDELDVPGSGPMAVTLIEAGRPLVLVKAGSLGLTGRELPADLVRARRVLERLQAVRVAAAVRMGWIDTADDAALPGIELPDIGWVAAPTAYRTLSGQEVRSDRIDLLVRLMAQRRLRTIHDVAASTAVAIAAALPGTIVHQVARTLPGVPTRLGHVWGTIAVGADLSFAGGCWRVDRAILSHGARRLMSGWVHVPPASAAEAT